MFAAALSQAWPPFVLVAALLVIGAVAHRDGLFERLGILLDRVPGPPVLLFGAACLLLAGVTALMNLDTAVVFVMPVIVLAARRRGMPTTPFIYATLFMANASSLYLPGSNLTNLLVLAGQHLHGSFAARMLDPALAATLVTLVGLAFAFRGVLNAAGEPKAPGGSGSGSVTGLGAGAALAAVVLMIVFANPALEVAGVALIVAAVARARRQIGVRELLRAASPQVLLGLMALAVCLGVLARAWDGPEHLLAHAGSVETSALAAVATVLVNNLPAAVLLSAHSVPHPQALLIGLNLGPNLAVSGSLAAFLWMRTAAQIVARTSVVAVSRLGLVLAPAAIAAALLVSGAT